MHSGPREGNVPGSSMRDLTLGCKHVSPASSFDCCANLNESLEVSELLVKGRIMIHPTWKACWED